MRRVLLTTILLIVTAVSVQAVVAEFPVAGFTLTDTVTYTVPPDVVFEGLTGDITGWWDHSFSGKPKAMVIEPKPGGKFYEVMDDQGNGVVHATVIYVEKNKVIRMEGPLGLSGRAVQMVTTITLEADGTGTRLIREANIQGQIDEKLAGIVDNVWHHFLFEQLKPYVENGQ